MKPALKWGIAGAAGIAIALAIKNISDENEETAEQQKTMLAQLANKPTDVEIIETYGEWRHIEQATPFQAYHLGEPENVPGKKLINVHLELQGDWQWGFIATPSWTNGHFGMVIFLTVPSFSGNFRIVGEWI